MPTVENRNRGITFHKFPKDKDVRKKWEVALRREGFTASDYSIVCSEHFKQADFDRVRLSDYVMVLFHPSSASRFTSKKATSTSRSAEESLWPLRIPQKWQPHTHNLSLMIETLLKPCSSLFLLGPCLDHGYALPASPTALKAKINQHLARVEMKGLLGDLRENNLIKPSEKLAFYSDLKMDFAAKQGHEYRQDCREFTLTLHLHGPKAYKYLRETRHFPLPHPQTLQRWLRSVDAKPGLNKMMLERRCQGDPAKYGSVSLMLDAMSIKKHVQYNPHKHTYRHTHTHTYRMLTCV
ncbi:DNA transposase THAP9 [Merluccius polli]|uniref:THAP domain-containing protein 1 n=1 Tax=Merluccius polli TaxID=89951 RepID=A0AA47P049_MERPO|nr:DNA transposase THAP9 [Merluccius polli]